MVPKAVLIVEDDRDVRESLEEGPHGQVRER